MIPIPLMYIKAGRCVSPVRGFASNGVSCEGADRTKIYPVDPLRLAVRWEEEGAGVVHIVDVEGALTGLAKNLPVAQKIAKELVIPVHFGGGIRNLNDVQAVLDRGIKRVVVGTKVVESEEFLKQALTQHGRYITANLDYKQGLIYLRGRGIQSPFSLKTTAIRLAEMGVRKIILTDISRDDTLTESDLQLIKELASEVPGDIIVAGGISHLEYLEKLKDLNIFGVILERALMEERIKLEETIALCGRRFW